MPRSPTVKTVTRDRVAVLTIRMVGSYTKIVASCIQPRVVEFRQVPHKTPFAHLQTPRSPAKEYADPPREG